MTVHRICILSALCGVPIPIDAADECAQWESNSFFRTASVEDVAACMQSEIDLTARDEFDRTPLHIAAMYNDRPLVITALVAAGADPRMRDRRDHTPLHSAAMASRSAPVIAAMVQAGADPNAPSLPASMEDLIVPAGQRSYSFYGFELWGTPWFFENLELRRERRSAAEGAPPKDNPLIAAALLGGENPTVFAMLAELASFAHPGVDHEFEPRSNAVEFGDSIGTMTELLAMLKARDSYGLRPIHVAARFNDNAEIIDALAVAGANVNAPTVHEYNALHIAAGHGESPAVVKALVDVGVDLTARSASGDTPLLVAASSSVTPSVVKALVDAGANLDTRDQRGRTPLHRAYARYHRSSGIVDALLAAGADPDARDSLGRTPVDLRSW